MEIKPNTKQQECIENISGKYLVLAGPGTGKTFTIVERIKNMLEKGIKPSEILCLTFSDSASSEMKSRINNTEINVYTYHSFCNEIINENSAEFGLNDNFKMITPAITISILKECIDEFNPVYYRGFKNDPYVFIKDIKSQIDAIKINRLTKEKYLYNLEHNQNWIPQLKNLKNELEDKNKSGAKITKKLVNSIDSLEKKIEKAKELIELFNLYNKKMQELHLIDFNDMINYVLDKFESEPDFLYKITNRYKYILVDEYQDTNKNQNDIVFHLVKSLDSENVFVVGDDDQIIYTFQGARLDTIERFLKEFPDTKVICLTENMRSTQSILDTSNSLLKYDTRRLENNSEFSQYNIDKRLFAKNKNLISKDKKVRLYIYEDILQEYNEIVQEIDTLIKSNNCPENLSEIAILTTKNSELETFAQMLKDRNIPYELKDGKSIFEIKASTILYYYMQLLVNPELHSDKFFKLILSKPFSFHPKDFEIIYNKKAQNKCFADCIKLVDFNEFYEPEKVKKFIKTFDYLTEYKTNETLKNIILEIGYKTGIFGYYINSELNQTENIAGIKKIIDEASDYSQKQVMLEDFVEYLEMALLDDIPIKTSKAPTPMNAVQLSTYHSSKGREFEYVYMPTLLRDRWESDRKSLKPIIPLSQSEYKTEEELKEMKISDKIKLMYVGMTRAKHTLRLSFPKVINEKPQTATEFITNIKDYFEIKNAKTYDTNSYWKEVSKSFIKRDYDYKRDFNLMTDEIMKNRSFSPSAINMYLSCPREYFYNYILDLKERDRNIDSFSFGTAVHRACEFAINYAIKNKNYPSKKEFINEFLKSIEKLTLSNFQQYEIHKQRGEKALEKFYFQLCSTPIENIYKTEAPVNFEMDGIKFYGIIDRIDKNSDGTYTIYDYKTGKAKGLNQICENGENENYYNQMGLYKNYFQKSTGNIVKDTIFIFPEEYENNLSIKYTDEDCLKIEQKFKDAILQIKSHNFEPKYEKRTCENCRFKEFCNLENI
ncbi:ATP-dependent helicase [bacterium]|nr:ATP-dependent helicase [bacterium]